jgi:8-oxo-dGTP diphosphatase
MSKMGIEHFNLRVYGLLFNGEGSVLVSDECRNGISFTKFPGGGVEYGEGLTDCLVREFNEELRISITVHELVYVNDFLQVSRFDQSQQLIAFYYRVSSPHLDLVVHGKHEVPLVEEGEKHRWIHVSAIQPEIFTFPVDQIIAQRLMEQGQSTW